VEPFNAVNKKVTWHSSDTSVATVDTRGLVTVVGPGTAVVTVETVEAATLLLVLSTVPVGN